MTLAETIKWLKCKVTELLSTQQNITINNNSTKTLLPQVEGKDVYQAIVYMPEGFTDGDSVTHNLGIDKYISVSGIYKTNIAALGGINWQQVGISPLVNDAVGKFDIDGLGPNSFGEISYGDEIDFYIVIFYTKL